MHLTVCRTPTLAFARSLQINLSQAPDLIRLQQRLYQQLLRDEGEMPAHSQQSPHSQLAQLRRAAAERKGALAQRLSRQHPPSERR